MNKITGDYQDDEDSIKIPTDGNLSIVTADNCYFAFDEAPFISWADLMIADKTATKETDGHSVDMCLGRTVGESGSGYLDEKSTPAQFCQ